MTLTDYVKNLIEKIKEFFAFEEEKPSLMVYKSKQNINKDNNILLKKSIHEKTNILDATNVARQIYTDILYSKIIKFIPEYSSYQNLLKNYYNIPTDEYNQFINTLNKEFNFINDKTLSKKLINDFINSNSYTPDQIEKVNELWNTIKNRNDVESLNVFLFTDISNYNENSHNIDKLNKNLVNTDIKLSKTIKLNIGNDKSIKFNYSFPNIDDSKNKTIISFLSLLKFDFLIEKMIFNGLVDLEYIDETNRNALNYYSYNTNQQENKKNISQLEKELDPNYNNNLYQKNYLINKKTIEKELYNILLLSQNKTENSISSFLLDNNFFKGKENFIDWSNLIKESNVNDIKFIQDNKYNFNNDLYSLLEEYMSLKNTSDNSVESINISKKHLESNTNTTVNNNILDKNIESLIYNINIEIKNITTNLESIKDTHNILYKDKIVLLNNIVNDEAYPFINNIHLLNNMNSINKNNINDLLTGLKSIEERISLLKEDISQAILKDNKIIQKKISLNK